MRRLSLNVSRVGEVALVVGLLWLARPVVVPVVLALYLAFVLAPACSWLERLGLPRVVSTSAVVGGALASVGVLGSMLFAQAVDLAAQVTNYSAQMSDKLASVRSGRLQVFNDLSSAFAELSRRVDPETAAELATPVRVVSGGGSTLARVEEAIGPILAPAGIALLVLVMTVFIVARREDLRGRLIQLLGPQNVTVTTSTLGEAVTRVGHLLITQLYINASFGAVIGVGLYLMGIPYALLWGAIAGVLRFVPLLGAWIAGLLPALVAFAVFPGWREVVFTVGFFLATDLTLSNFVEPMVLGRRTGVSALALLVSALFWTWLWGPLGLVLATPITVCAAVVGRHVSGLSFLAIALGDEPGLNADVDFYQRMLANARKDALLFAKRRASATSVAQTFDEVLVPALGLLSNDVNSGTVNDATAARVARDIGDIAQRLAPSGRASLARAGNVVLGIASEPLVDAALVQTLKAALAANGGSLASLEAGSRDDVVAQVVAQKPEVVCIAGMPPAGNVNARYLCRKLRLALPEAFVVVLLPDTADSHHREAAARLREAGASVVTHTVAEAVQLLAQHGPDSVSTGARPSVVFAG